MKLDMSAALEAVENDQDLLRIVLEALLEETPNLVEQLDQAIRHDDASTVQRAAHTINGTMRLFPDQPVRSFAGQLETMGREKDLTGAAVVFESLRSAANEFRSQLKASLGN